MRVLCCNPQRLTPPGSHHTCQTGILSGSSVRYQERTVREQTRLARCRTTTEQWQPLPRTWRAYWRRQVCRRLTYSVKTIPDPSHTDSDDSYNLDLCIKVARPNRCRSLAREAWIYEQLSEGVIQGVVTPCCYGFFAVELAPEQLPFPLWSGDDYFLWMRHPSIGRETTPPRMTFYTTTTDLTKCDAQALLLVLESFPRGSIGVLILKHRSCQSL
ncbi:uncharacterized protein C8Q71DRAFT_200692 [Rhodofomes roseus]|uniref:Uncharacterized protein n=1 Tax=Rhodofomes roseus TaxID=34475 RepID=A0ABQ8KTG5_9APHY|nr:uncharacterized protein C8Q71DRAFT_200692 [Rhodofomes roseus]KAH9842372.1 hypothetical protein C8Q71DRAFT_200692 [Rhodofomes roseus]